jgi:hypothetical protein
MKAVTEEAKNVQEQQEEIATELRLRKITYRKKQVQTGYVLR